MAETTGPTNCELPREMCADACDYSDAAELADVVDHALVEADANEVWLNPPRKVAA